MAEYISSFITGFDSVIGVAMTRALSGVKIIKMYDGLVHYSYGGNAQNINRLSFFNNSFLVYKVYKGSSLSFDKMVSQASIPVDKGKRAGTFRVRFSKENQFVKVGKQTAFIAENRISGKTNMKVDRVTPQNEYWFIIRRENIGFFGKLLRKRKITEKALHKGELRPEFALLMCVFAGIKHNEIICDPFAGYGAIPIQAVQSYRIAKMYVCDNDKNLVDRLNKIDTLKRCSCEVSIKCENALQLESVKDNEISLIITDPPWGYYEDIPDIEEFYNAMFRSFKRILKAEGRAVVLSARKNEIVNAVKSEAGYITKHIDTLVDGKKAGIYVVQFNKREGDTSMEYIKEDGEERKMIKQIFDGEEKKRITRQVLEALPDWFGIPEAREDYIKNSVDQIFFAATEQDRVVGFIYLKETGKETVELYVMGVLKEYHRRGIGRELFEVAKACAVNEGYSFMQVKTVQMGKYKEYDDTNRFYIKMGFKEFELFPTLWDEWNPCQIYVMTLK